MTTTIKTIAKNITKGLAFGLLGVSQFAVAKNIGTVAQGASTNFNAVGLAAQAFFGLCGLIFIGLAIFTFVKYNKTDGQGAKISTAFVYLIGGGVLFYMASLVQTTGDSIWGDGGGDRSKIQLSQ